MVEYNENKSKAIMSINTLANSCGYFYNAYLEPIKEGQPTPNNGYNCKHPNCDSFENDVGCCFTFSCPLAIEANEEDCTEFGIEYEDSEFVVTDNEFIIKKLRENEAINYGI